MIDALPPVIACEAPVAVDGDTLRCGNIAARIRLIGIDAPEMAGRCRRGRVCTPGDGAAARQRLEAIIGKGSGVVRAAGFDRYGRVLARVRFGGVDASCAMVASGAAVRRYAAIDCP